MSDSGVRVASENHVRAMSGPFQDRFRAVIPVSQSIYYEMGPARRKEMGIAESLIRISVGIEEIDDLIEDFRTALES